MSKILSFLSLNELLRLRLICKGWQSFINQFEQKDQLCVYEEVIPHRLKWESDRTYVRWMIKINTSKLDFKDPFLKRLKRVFVYKIKRQDLFKSLEELKNLEELSFYLGEPYSYSEHLLNLPNLKTLTLFNCPHKLTLDTPKLENFYPDAGFPERLLVVHPDSIRSIKSHGLDYLQIKKFSNLRRIVTRVVFQLNLQLDLKDFPELKTVELYTFGKEGKKSLARELAKSLEKQRSELGRSDPLILVNAFSDVEFGLKVNIADNDNTVGDIETVWENIEKMVTDFEYPISFHYEFYLQLARYGITDEERRKFMAKFKGIKKLRASEVPDSTEFLEFLNEWGNFIKILKLQNSAHVFNYQQLTKFQRIKELYISETRVNLSYNFLLELRNLEIFKLFTSPQFLSVELLYLANELLKRWPVFVRFHLLNIQIRRSDSRCPYKITFYPRGLVIYNWVYYKDKTLEEIFEILMQKIN